MSASEDAQTPGCVSEPVSVQYSSWLSVSLSFPPIRVPSLQAITYSSHVALRSITPPAVPHVRLARPNVPFTGADGIRSPWRFFHLWASADGPDPLRIWCALYTVWRTSFVFHFWSARHRSSLFDLGRAPAQRPAAARLQVAHPSHSSSTTSGQGSWREVGSPRCSSRPA